MSIVNNSQSLSFINESHGFVTGMVVSYAKGLVCDVQLSGSNQRFPNSWKNLPAKITYKDEEILIEFLRPGNYYNIKLEIYGLEKDSITATFIQSKILDRSEVLKRLKEKTITFAAPVRNCGSALRSGIELASKLGEYFKDYKIAIFENDSIDDTKNILREIQKDQRIIVIQRDGLDDVFPFRTERISFARNSLFEQVKKNDSDYFCTMDLDGVIGENFSFDGFLSNFAHDDCWDAVFPANTDKYYDIWTLRHEGICAGDYERQMNAMDPIFSNEIIYDACLNNLQTMDFRKLKGWLQVSSAFGGMGIYKTEKFVHSSYFGVKDGYEVSDHVAFHLKAVESGAMLYINPEFLVDSKLGL